MRPALLLVCCACGRLEFGARADAGGGGLGDAAPRSWLTVAPPSEALVDFPLLVILDDTRADRAAMRPDASDLRFYDSAGNVLPLEIEQVGAPGAAPLVGWIRVSLDVGAMQTIGVDYGQPDPPPLPAGSVWSADYAAVYHLADLTDATTNHHDGAWSGGAQATVTGQIGPTQQYVGAQMDSIGVADAADLAFTQITASGWLYAQTLAAASGYAAIVSRENGNGVNDDFWIGCDDAGPEIDAVVTTSTGAQLGGPSAQPLSLATWTHIAMTYDGAKVVIYEDGAAILTKPVTGTMLRGAHPILLGADRNNGGAADADFVDGMIDEVRLEHVARSPAWIAFDDASQRDLVITYGAP
ncbi:MAG TPA: LamG-like jellyroll fold domain-containing protein [Kofleriaceae bacterium]|nr:LamG-like jellyroll fold domain-containing protein [Kofleriaceae bacterium]